MRMLGSHAAGPRIVATVAVMAVLAVGLIAAAPPGAAASSAGRTGFGLSFTTQRPDSSTGYALSIHYQDPSNQNGKPTTFHKVVIELPPGTRFDTGVVSTCTASDAQLMALGASACPADSKVGAGAVTLLTGFGAPTDPFATDVSVFQGPSELIDVFTAKGSDRPLAVDRVQMSGATLTDHPQAVPGGPPDGRSAVRDVNLTIQPRNLRAGATHRDYLRTPASCPPSGAWQARITVDYDDGVSDNATSSTPCTSAGTPGPNGAPPPRPRMRLAVRPSLTRAGQRTRFRFHLTLGGRNAACASAATIRFAGRRVRTDRHGRASIVATFRRAGIYRARASKRGYLSASARIRVRASRRHCQDPDHDRDCD
jgi:hypothetical protein